MPTWVVFGIVLSVLVLVHELGHFIAARILGIKVEEFAFGLPFTKPIFKIRKGETEYAIYPLLFGGFVKLYGEEGPASPKATQGEPRSFWDRGRKQRMLVIAAGVIMNVALAIGAFVVLYTALGVPQRKVEKVTILKIENGSPADEAGFIVDDRIVAVEGKPVTAAQFSGLMRSWAGLSVNVTVERGRGTFLFEGIAEGEKKTLDLRVVPRMNPPEGQGPLGVAIASYPYLESTKCQGLSVKCILGSITAGVKSTGVWVERVIDGLRGIGKSLVAGKKPEGVSGPVGIYQLTEVVAKGGFWPVLELVAILSINLAVFNVLPIPALDGGRMLFIWVEWLRKKRMSVELEQKINSWGMAFLIGLLVLITLQDVVRSLAR